MTAGLVIVGAGAVLAGALLGLSEILPFIPVTPCHISVVH
jgi:hypothetical protein